MRRAIPYLLASLLLASCGPKEDYLPTKRVLVNAHTARTGVSHITMRYAEVLGSAPGGADPAVRGWEGLTGFRESAEGLAAKRLLSEYSKPISVDPANARRSEIEAVSLATAELVNLALEPRGTWESFSREITGARSRLDRAVSALEAGTKDFVLIETRTETNKTSFVYADTIARAKAADSEKAGKSAP
jgi:hypothetical protein